jgi:hypothetical protein
LPLSGFTALHKKVVAKPVPRHLTSRGQDALRWLGQGIQPSRSALYHFRDRIDTAVFALHAAAIRQAMAEGFTTAEHGVLDGTAIRARASRHHLVHEEKLRASPETGWVIRLQVLEQPRRSCGPVADITEAP